MKPLHCLRLAACACVCLAASLGCSSGSGKPRVAFVSNNPEAFWSIAEAGARKAADDAGVELIFQKPPSGDIGEQKKKVDQVLHQGIKGVAISVIDPEKQHSYLE